MLLLDDVQFLADKVRTKEELFHTFNALYESGRQLVFTSDRSPTDLEAFEDRLKERFECGLVAEVVPPEQTCGWRSFASGSARTGSRTSRTRRSRPSPAPWAPASGFSKEPSSASSRTHRSRDKPPTPELAMQVLGRLYRRGPTQPCSVQRIQEATAEEFGISPEALLARDRTPNVAFARQVAMYLAREMTDQGLPALGREFGGRNHTTVLHAWKRVSELVDKPGEKRETVVGIRRRLEAETAVTTVPLTESTACATPVDSPIPLPQRNPSGCPHDTSPTSSRQDQ